MADIFAWIRCALFAAISLSWVSASPASAILLDVEPAAAAPGGAVVIAVALENEVPLRGIQFDLGIAPAQLRLTGVRSTARTQNLTVDAYQRAGGVVTAIVISLGNTTLAAGVGAILLLEFDLDPSAAPGARIALQPGGVRSADTSGAPLFVPATGGVVIVRSPCAGDCNGDQSVTVNEVVALVNIASGISAAQGCLAGDVDGDDQITVNEVVLAVLNALNGCP